MKNRIWNKAKRFGLSAVLFTTMVCGKQGWPMEISAADVDNPQIDLVQTVQWTDAGQYKAQIRTEISGLKAYVDKITQKPEKEPEGNQEENPDETQEETQEGTQEAEELPELVNEETLDYASLDTASLESQEEWTEIPTDELVEIVEYSAGEQGELEEYAESAEETAIPELYFVDYISEYFRLDTELIPQSCLTEAVTVTNQRGGETQITKVVYPIDLTSVTEENLVLVFPVVLREEYRISESNVQYPVNQDEPLDKDCTGAGAFIMEKTGDESKTLSELPSPVLEILAAASGFSMELRPQAAQIKAGQPYTYELNVTNTGELPLSNIMINSRFSMGKIKAVWESAKGVQVNGKQAVIERLDRGETCTMRMSVQLTEEQSGELLHEVSGEALKPGNSGESIRQEAGTKINIMPLTANFTVEKTADRTEAVPGDTINYQICIRNTGERTLHSVLSTERFVNANIQAQFLPKEGVILNSTKTQAFIREIAPGEAVALLAAVTLPEYFQSQELINRVTVVSEETGEQSVQSESEITVTAPQPTPFNSAQTYYQSGNMTKTAGSNAYQPSSKPKTGDETEAGLFVLLLIIAAAAGAGVFWKVKAKSRH